MGNCIHIASMIYMHTRTHALSSHVYTPLSLHPYIAYHPTQYITITLLSILHTGSTPSRDSDSSFPMMAQKISLSIRLPSRPTDSVPSPTAKSWNSWWRWTRMDAKRRPVSPVPMVPMSRVLPSVLKMIMNDTNYDTTTTIIIITVPTT